MKRSLLLLALALATAAGATERPNVVLILLDDLGYGDVSANHPAGRIRTPHMDRLAREGMRFTDAHTPSSVCTPTRYGLLTGRYAWRTRLQQGVLGGLSPSLIEPGRETLASLLRRHGYHTSAIGKWHLGLDWTRLPGKEVTILGVESPAQVRHVDYAAPIGGGPRGAGFERFFGIAASLDMVPYTFIENDRVTALPTLERTWPLHPGHPGECRTGPAAPGFEVDQVLPELTRQAVATIEARAAAGRPFFLYLPLASPHTPIAPTPSWKGRSGLNLYADFVLETDDAIGRVLAALDRTGATRDTFVLLTSDNGCSPQARIEELAALGHQVSGPLRGHKADLFDGGHRVPFLVRWPARVRPGVSDQLVCLTDVLATCAEILGVRLPDDAGEDSFSFLPVLEARGPGTRASVVHHSITGAFAVRQGPWKLALSAGSGGWSAPRDPEARQRGLPATQLHRIGEGDLAEARNVVADHPEVADRLEALLREVVDRGRSTPGRPQANAVPVVLRKPVPAAKAKARKAG